MAHRPQGPIPRQKYLLPACDGVLLSYSSQFWAMDQNEESFFWQNQFQMRFKIEIIYKESKAFCGSDNHNTYAGFTKIKKVFF